MLARIDITILLLICIGFCLFRMVIRSAFFYQVTKSLRAVKSIGKFTIKMHKYFVHWSSVSNTEMTKQLSEYVCDSYVFNEFCLGGFSDQHLLNVLVLHKRDVDVPKCRYDYFFSFFIFLKTFYYLHAGGTL